MELEICIDGIKKMRVNKRWIECLLYSTIDENGEIIGGSVISLDKKWFKPARSPQSYKGKWVELEFYPKLNKYGFPDTEGSKTDQSTPYTLYSEIIQAVDSVIAKIIEREILS